MKREFKSWMMAGAVLSFTVMVPGVSAQISEKYEDVAATLVVEANTVLDMGDAEKAQQIYERALVANPASMQALIGLGKAHEAQGRVGRGLKYYRQALTLDPNALGALEAQAVAFLKRDMVDRAEANRDRLVQLCGECTALSTVESAIDTYRAEESAKVAEAETEAKPATTPND